MQHLTDYYILYLLLICRIFLKYGTGNVMNNKIAIRENKRDKIFLWNRIYSGTCTFSLSY